MICTFGVTASKPDKPTLYLWLSYLWQPVTTTGHVNDLLKQRV